MDDALIAELAALGARIDVEPRARSDGVRGLFATRDLDAEERACWVPNEAVLELSNCDPALRDAIQAVLVGVGEAHEREVYARMIALVAGYLLERERGTASRFGRYVAALPTSYPPTANTFSPAERAALVLLTGHDAVNVYGSLVCYTFECLQRAWEGPTAPTRSEVEAAFFFVLSRMSYMRLIPLCDLANAALPGEENARIVVEGQVEGGREGCAVVTRRPVKAGEEVTIDYNHHDGLGMLAGYGCTLGLEHVRSVTKLQLGAPPFLEQMGMTPAGGVQLCEEEPAVLPEKALMLLRFGALGNRDQLLAAAQAGYFEDRAGPEESVRAWDRQQARMYHEVAGFCAKRRLELEEAAGPAVRDLDTGSLAGRVLVTQYETDRRLLSKCEQVMRSRAAALLEDS